MLVMPLAPSVIGSARVSSLATSVSTKVIMAK
jgi:hypothetical protein